MVDALDLKSKGLNKPCRFESCHPHHLAGTLRCGISARPQLLAQLLGFIVSSKRLIVSSTSRCDPLRGGIRAKPWLLAQLLGFIVSSKRLIVSSTSRCDPLRGGIRAKPWLLAQLLGFIVSSKRLIVSSTSRCDPLRGGISAKPWLLAPLLGFIVSSKRLIVSSTLRAPCRAASVPSVMPPPTVKPHNFSAGLIEPIPLFEMKTGEVAACPRRRSSEGTAKTPFSRYANGEMRQIARGLGAPRAKRGE